MELVEHMMTTTPNRARLSERTLAVCVRACAEAELACIACADACLGEADVARLRKCIRRTLDCADICHATSRVLERTYAEDLDLLELQVKACERACASCAAECHLHEMDHEHCETCGQACRAAEAACRDLVR